MNFEWSPELTAFRSRVQAAIRDGVAPGWTHANREMPTLEDRERARAFCHLLGQRGLLTPHWPREYGGRDASPWELVILSEEMWAAGEPRGSQYLNVNWIGPTIMQLGTPEQRDLHLPLMARGDVFWCQGFSEPDAGSDLVAIRTSAIRDGDRYHVSGQKVWTSYAHVADYCLLLVRTSPFDPARPRHGITVLLMPMDLPGVEVREIPTPHSPHLLHEIFIGTDVATACRLGEEGHGWEVVRLALATERIGVVRQVFALNTLDQAYEELADPSAARHLAHQTGLGYATVEAWRAVTYAAVQERITDRTNRRPMASVARGFTGIMEPTLAGLCAELLGDRFIIGEGDPSWQLVNGTVAPLAAGSLEVQLDLIAREVLRLPRGRV